MRLHPAIAPVEASPPVARVEMKGTKVQSVYLEVGSEIEALAELVRIAAITSETEALISKRDEMVRVEALDKGRGFSSPFRDHVRVAAIAARFIGELPG